MQDRVVGLIPVRIESSRLPGKALLPIDGLPAIIHTYKRALLSKSLSDVIVCTDSEDIQSTLIQHNVKVEMTEPHINGSERIYEIAKKYNYKNILNIQGDEILLQPEHIDKMVQSMLSSNEHEFFIGITDFQLLNEKNVFKAVTNKDGEMMYCSREDIPSPAITNKNNFKKVVFLVGYKNYSLNRFIEWGECNLENDEPNEFLRILYHGEKISTVKLRNAQISLDTHQDLETIQTLILEDKWRSLY